MTPDPHDPAAPEHPPAPPRGPIRAQPHAHAVELAGVTLARGGRSILSNATLRIGAGEFVTVLGANGAGKTTLMRAILGLVPPAAGAIRVLGEPARRGHPAIGAMPQSRGLPAVRLSGREFVQAACRGRRWGLALRSAADRRDVDRALGLVDASALAARPVAELSGGERQRLLLAQALLGRPRLLLLDEPLAGLDPRRQAGIVSLVRGLQRELGIAVLFSTHDLNPMLAGPMLPAPTPDTQDRVLVLGHGEAALGTPDEVVTGPVLSRLYGTPIEVVHTGRRRIVVAAPDPPRPFAGTRHAAGGPG